MQPTQMQARRLAIAMSNIDSAYFESTKEQDVKESEIYLMYALDDGKPHSQREIVQEWLISKTTLNTIVKQWEREGLLELTAIPGKRRERSISLTEAGRQRATQTLDYLYRAEERAMEQTFARYSPDFLEAVEFFGEALKQALKEETGENE